MQQKRASWRVYSCEGKNHPINPSIRKDEAKVVDTVDVSQQEKNQVAYCRCWRSGTFPMCDGTYYLCIQCDSIDASAVILMVLSSVGSHMKHNEAEGDNVGPLLVKK